MRILRRAALAVAMVLAPAAHAGSCGYDYCWGAVGFGPNGAWGYSYGQFSEDEAVNVAQDGCGWNCTVVKTFYNTCGAIAVADNGGWGWGWAPSRSDAESTAIAYCVENGRNCRVRAWACST